MTNKNQAQEPKNIISQRPSQPMVQGLDVLAQHVSPAVVLQRVMAAPPPAVNPADILALQRTVGNRTVQRTLAVKSRRGDLGLAPLHNSRYVGGLIQRGDEEEAAGGAAAEGVEVPGVTGSGAVGLIGDILTALDTTVGVVDLFGLAVLDAGGAAAVAPFILVPLSAIAFIVGGLVMLGEANSSSEKWAAVQGASYAIVSHALGRRPPRAPGWMGSGDVFNSQVDSVTARLSQQVDQRGDAGRRVAGSLVSIREQDPATALNNIYQRLCREHLQQTFLGFEIGGAFYNNVRGYRFTWPEVGMNRSR